MRPPLWPYRYPMDRDAGIDAYQAIITAEAYQDGLVNDQTGGLALQVAGLTAFIAADNVGKVEIDL